MADILPLCPSCSTPLPPGALYCTICGVATPTSLGGSDPALAAAPTQQLSGDDESEQAYRDRLQRALGNAYVLGERIGRGGFGAVYRLRDVRLKRDVAVKVLRSDLMESRQMEVRFLREAEAVAQLRHPNIIPIYGVGEGDGLIYFIMPLVQGESLLARLQREGPLPIPEVRRVLADVASALTVAHQAGIVHRDLKPENIMLEGDARHVLLMDFGIAKTLGSGGAGALTSQGMILGTPYYMSPEQAMGAAELDGRSDVYSLGVVGFQMLTGRVPFLGESVQSVLLMHISAPPPEIQALRPDTPPALSKLVMRCLAKRPRERWSSSAELAGALAGASPPGTATSWRLPRPAWLTGRRVVLGVAGLVAIAIGTFAVTRLRGRAGEARPGHTPWEDLGVTIPYDTLAYRLDRPHWLASLADTLLIVPFDSPGELWAFSGDSLHVLRGTMGSESNPPYVVARDTAWSANEYGIDYLSAHGSVPIAGMPGEVAVRSTWSDGRDLIVGRANGSILRRIAGGWRREATGTRHAIREIFGRDTLHQYALADVADARVTDSLFIYDGLGWSARDVRPDSSVRARYIGGRSFADGGTVLVGSACGGAGACRPLALRQDSAGRWHDIPLAISPSVRLSGVWGTSSGDFYTWGIDTLGATPVGCGGGGPCLWHVTRRGVEPVTALGPTRVIGMAGLRGAPYVLLEDGTLRTPRGSGWPVAARMPSLALIAVAPLAGTGPVMIDDRGNLHVGDHDIAPPPGQRFSSLASADSTAWLLTDSGVVMQMHCTDLGCPREVLPRPDRRHVNGIAVLANGSLEVVGGAGLAAVWTGTTWRPDSIPIRKPGEDLLHLAANHWGAAASGANLYVRDGAGRWSFLTDQGDSDFVFAPLADSTVAGVTSWDSFEDDTHSWHLDRYWLLKDVKSSTRDNSDELMDSNVPMSIHVLPDGRLVVGLRQPDDPSVGGWLQIWSPPYAENRFVRVELPRRSDVYGLADDGRYLYVVGSGWFSMRIPIDSLPRAR